LPQGTLLPFWGVGVIEWLLMGTAECLKTIDDGLMKVAPSKQNKQINRFWVDY